MSLFKFKDVYSDARHYSPLLLFFGLGLFAFYLTINFSKDWQAYLWLYGMTETKPWHLVLTDLSLFKEPLFLVFSKFLGELIGYPAFIFISVVLLLVIKLRYLEKIVDNPYTGTFFYVCLYLLLFEGTAIRIGLATSLVIPAIYLLKQQKYLYSILLIILASQIHLSAILFLIVFPLYFYTRLTTVSWVLFLISPLFALFDVSIFSYFTQLIGLINPRYLLYDEDILVNQNSTGLYFYFIAFFSIMLIIIYAYLKELISRDAFTRVVFSVCLLAIFFMCAFYDHVAVGARLGELLLLPIVILLSMVYQKFSDRKMLFCRAAIISIFIIYFVARFHYLYPKVFI